MNEWMNNTMTKPRMNEYMNECFLCHFSAWQTGPGEQPEAPHNT